MHTEWFLQLYALEAYFSWVETWTLRPQTQSRKVIKTYTFFKGCKINSTLIYFLAQFVIVELAQDLASANAPVVANEEVVPAATERSTFFVIH